MAHGVYENDITATPIRILRSRAYNFLMGERLRALKMSGDKTWTWIEAQINERHSGKIYILPRVVLSKERLHLEELFGECPRSAINKYKRRTKTLPKQREQIRVLQRIVIFDCADQIDAALTNQTPVGQQLFCKMQRFCGRKPPLAA